MDGSVPETVGPSQDLRNSPPLPGGGAAPPSCCTRLPPEPIMTMDPTLLAHTPQTFLIPAPALPATPMPTPLLSTSPGPSAQTTTPGPSLGPQSCPTNITALTQQSARPRPTPAPNSLGAQASSRKPHASPGPLPPSKTPPARPPRTWLTPSHTHETEGYLSVGQEALRVGPEKPSLPSLRAALKRTAVP